MKKSTISILLSVSIIVGYNLFTVESQANSAYQYHILYKNSETYKVMHEGEEEAEQEQQPQLDGWGNLVDEPPPPPPDNNVSYAEDDQTSNEETKDSSTENSGR